MTTQGNTIIATPRMLANKEWGAQLPPGYLPQEGDRIRIVTKKGKTWEVLVDKIVKNDRTTGALVSTVKAPKAPKGDSAPTPAQQSTPSTTEGMSALDRQRIRAGLPPRGAPATPVPLPPDEKFSWTTVSEQATTLPTTEPGRQGRRLTAEDIRAREQRSGVRSPASVAPPADPPMPVRRSVRMGLIQPVPESTFNDLSGTKVQPISDKHRELLNMLSDFRLSEASVVETKDEGKQYIRPFHYTPGLKEWYQDNPFQAQKALAASGFRLTRPADPRAPWELNQWKAAPDDAKPTRQGYWLKSANRPMTQEELHFYDHDRYTASKATEPAATKKRQTPIPQPVIRDKDTGKRIYYREYQKAGIRTTHDRQNALIADEPGVGKTIQALGVANMNPKVKRILVVAPVSVRPVWPAEAQKWMVNPPKHMCIVSSSTGASCIPKSGPVLAVTNYEAFRPNSKIFKELRNGKWDMIVLDESHHVKNPSALKTVGLFGGPEKRNKDGKIIHKAIKPIEAKQHKIALTGTPVDKAAEDVYGVMSWLQPEEFPPQNRESFIKRYTKEPGSKPALRNIRETELQNILRSTIMVRRLREDVLTELPPVQRKVVLWGPESTTPAIQDAIAQGEALEAKYGLSLQDMMGDGTNKLGQRIPVPISEISKVRVAMAKAKAPLIAQHLAEATESGEPIIYFTHHDQEVVPELEAALDKQGIEYFTITGAVPQKKREEIIRKFQDEKKGQILIASIGTLAEGVTLTRANRVVFGDFDWSGAKMGQSEARVNRLGQKNPILVEQLLVANSFDANLVDTVNRKMEMANNVMGVSKTSMVNRLSPDEDPDMYESPGSESPDQSQEGPTAYASMDQLNEAMGNKDEAWIRSYVRDYGEVERINLTEQGMPWDDAFRLVQNRRAIPDDNERKLAFAALRRIKRASEKAAEREAEGLPPEPPKKPRTRKPKADSADAAKTAKPKASKKKSTAAAQMMMDTDTEDVKAMSGGVLDDDDIADMNAPTKSLESMMSPEERRKYAAEMRTPIIQPKPRSGRTTKKTGDIKLKEGKKIATTAAADDDGLMRGGRKRGGRSKKDDTKDGKKTVNIRMEG